MDIVAVHRLVDSSSEGFNKYTTNISGVLVLRFHIGPSSLSDLSRVRKGSDQRQNPHEQLETLV